MMKPRRLLVILVLLIGGLWAALVPPFESPDESFYYQTSLEYARGGPRRGRGLYAVLVAPVLKLTRLTGAAFQVKYNPAFRFVSNRRGHVNMFLHGRLEGALRGDVNRMYVLRVVTLAFWLVTLILIFETARMFFGRSDLALMTAGFCLCLPGLAFFSSKIHPEVTAALAAAVAFWMVAARLTGRLGRTSAWIIGLATLGLAPLTDHQGYFLLLFVPVALVASEQTWKGAAAAAGVLAALALAALALPILSDLRGDVRQAAAPFMPGYRYGWWTPDMPRYLAFEFAPKMFLGFCGWLGQPSLLLPPVVYGAIAVSLLTGAIGLALAPASSSVPNQRRLAWLLLAGVVFALVPIVYTNILIDRTSYGRWLYPVLGPIMIGLVRGWRSFAETFRRHPHVVSLGLGLLAASLAGFWLSSSGNDVRLLIRGNHYGDADHLIRTVTAAIVLLAATAVALEGLWWLGGRIAPSARLTPRVALAAAVAGNLALLIGFVAPKYRDLDDQGFADLIREDVSRGEYSKAAALHRVAASAYPQSVPLRQVAIDSPMMLLRGGDDQLLATLRDRVARGQRLQTREELMAVARLAPTKAMLEPEVLREVLRGVAPSADVNEPAAILRAEVDGRRRDGTAAADVIHAGGGTIIATNMGDVAVLEGFTEYIHERRREVTVYFRPQRSWDGRRLWMHIYPWDSRQYLVADPAVPQRADWKPNELAWEIFRVPDDAAYVMYVGIDFEGNLGKGYPLGRVD